MNGALEAAPESLLLRAVDLIVRQLESETPAAAERPDAGYLCDLYGGPLGLALFWAALAECSVTHRDLATSRCLEQIDATRRRVLEWVSHPGDLDHTPPPLGGLCGLGAVLYTFGMISDLIRDKPLGHQAVAVAEILTPERIARDGECDVFHGVAGLILALRSLEDCGAAAGCSARFWSERVAACTDRLLRQRVRSREGLRVWSIHGRLRSGLPHGASGMALALLKAAERVAVPEITDAIREALSFERSLFDPATGNWLSHETLDRRAPQLVTWCRGAPGIAAARVAAAGPPGDDGWLADLRRALQATTAMRETLEDDLCCGNLGRAWILHEASQVLSDTEPSSTVWQARAEDLTRRTLRRVKGRGGFRWSKTPPGLSINPFFFQGAAGAGYALLAMTHPDRLPRPLTLEPPRAHFR